MNTNLTNLVQGYYSILATHIAESYAVAHGGIAGQGGTYLDSAGNVVGNVIINISVGGATYYVPASQSPSGVCHTQCHSDCHSDGGGNSC